YTIAASAGAGGSISPSGNFSVNCGDDQTFTIAADACHTIADVLVDGVSAGAVASYTFSNVTANHTIAASFALNPYTIAASAAVRQGVRELRRGPVVHHRRRRVLLDRRRARRRRICRGGGQLHVLERDGEPYDRGVVHAQHLHDRGVRRRRWVHLAVRQCERQL